MRSCLRRTLIVIVCVATAGLFFSFIFAMKIVAFQFEDETVVVAANWREVPTSPQNQPASQAYYAEMTVPLLDDPLITEQWYLSNVKFFETLGEIALETQWLELTPKTVALISSGVDQEHQELVSILLPGENLIDTSLPPIDDYGIGTHEAGLIGAIRGNGIGIAGIAPSVLIRPYKILDSLGSGSFANYAEAIRDATDDGVDIIYLGGVTAAESPLIDAAVQYANSRGVLLISPSGSSSGSVYWPAAFPDVMAIAATTISNTHAVYSNVGDEIEIAAPGGSNSGHILSTWPADVDCVEVAVLQSDGYCKLDGTHAAAAMVTGAAAFIWSIQPDLSAQEIRQILTDTAAPLDEPTEKVGAGLLDLHTAVLMAMPSKLLVSPTEISGLFVQDSPPFSKTISVRNPGIQQLEWSVSSPTAEWFEIIGDVQGSVSRSQPAQFALHISTPELTPNRYQSDLVVTGRLEDGSEISETITIDILVSSEISTIFLPIVQK